MINIPLESKNKDEFPLKKAERMIVAYAVLFGADNQTAFLRFHPEFTTDGKTLNQAGKVASRQFWSWGKVKDYRANYESDVQEFLNGKKSTVKSEAVSIDENRIENALKKLLNQAIGLLDSGDNLDPDSVKTIVEVFRKMNLLRDEEEQQIRPIRVLPSTCRECRYKAFVESAVSNNDAIDCCAWCKARKVAEENGYRFNDGKDLLEIPQEIIAELESKNNVKLTDILNGSVQN